MTWDSALAIVVMAALIGVGIHCYKSETPSVDMDVEQLRNCSYAQLTKYKKHDNQVFKVIYGEYVDNKGKRFLINPDGSYFIMTEHGSGLVTLDFKGNAKATTKNEVITIESERLNGDFYYCKQVLYNLTTSEKFFKICKCTL